MGLRAFRGPEARRVSWFRVLDSVRITCGYTYFSNSLLRASQYGFRV